MKKRVSIAIISSLINSIIAWIILNYSAQALENNVLAVHLIRSHLIRSYYPVWVILLIFVWLIISSAISKFNQRMSIITPTISIATVAIPFTIILYHSLITPDPKMILLGIHFGIVTGIFLTPFLHSALMISWVFNSDLRNWRKIKSISDIKNPTKKEKYAIKIAKEWYKNIPDSKEEDILSTIKWISESNDTIILDSRQYPNFQGKNKRMKVDCLEMKTIIETYETKNF